MSLEDRPPVIKVIAPDGTVVVKVFAEQVATFWVGHGYTVDINDLDRLGLVLVKGAIYAARERLGGYPQSLAPAERKTLLDAGGKVAP